MIRIGIVGLSVHSEAFAAIINSEGNQGKYKGSKQTICAESGHCFDVAIDHGFFNEFTFLNGIEDIEASVKVLIDANPDAIQLTVGQAKHLKSVPGKTQPALVLRTDLANVYCPELPDVLYSRMIEELVWR